MYSYYAANRNVFTYTPVSFISDHSQYTDKWWEVSTENFTLYTYIYVPISVIFSSSTNYGTILEQAALLILYFTTDVLSIHVTYVTIYT